MKTQKRNRRRTRRMFAEHLEDRRLLAAGALDPSFDHDGALIDKFNGRNEQGYAVAIYQDPASPHADKIVSASFGLRGDGDLIVRRLNPDGTPDLSFSGDGVFVERNFYRPSDVLIQPDGKIVVAAGGGDFALARLDVNGTLDTSFGGTGTVVTDIVGTAEASTPLSLERLADGRLLAVGIASTGQEHAIGMARYNPDGSLDNSFGLGGTASTLRSEFPGNVNIRVSQAVLIPGGNGAFYVGGVTWPLGPADDISDSDLFIAKYQADGSLDTTFGQNGITDIQRGKTTSNPSMAIGVLPDGRVQLAYDAIVGTYFNPVWQMEVDDPRLILARLHSDGTLDSNFGDQGVVTGPQRTEIFKYHAYNVTVQADGSILVGGEVTRESAFYGGLSSFVMVSRHRADGSLDPSFGNGGIAVPELPDYFLEEPARDLVVEPDGDIVLATSAWLTTETWREPQLAILRLDGDSVVETDVTAEFVNGQLIITGDETANHIRLTIDAAGNALVEGLQDTTINGLNSVSFSGITNPSDVVVSTAGGNDSVIASLKEGVFFRFFGIDTGKGKDFVNVDENGAGVLVQKILTGNGADHIIGTDLHSNGLQIDSGKGNDRVELRGSIISSSARIWLGAGDDALQGPTEWADTGAGGGAVVDGGAGTDRLFKPLPVFYKGFEDVIEPSDGTDSFVGGDVTTAVIADPKIGNILVVKGNDHFDHDLQLSSSTLGQVTIIGSGYGATIDGVASSVSFNDIARVKVITGSGTDTVLAEGLLLSDKLIVNTGLGDDSVQVLGSQLEKLKINTGGGDDTVLIDTTTVNRRTKVVAGWGEDDVTIRDSIFGRKVTLESGVDDDTLHLLGVNLFSKGLEDDFEQVL